MTVVVALQDRLPDVSGVDRWLYAGQDAAWRIAVEAGPLAGIPRIETAELLQRKARELRGPFLEWVGELGATNDSVEWWATQLAARTSYTGFYDRVCSLAAALESLDGDGTRLVVCDSAALAQEIARAAGAPPPAPPAAGAASGDRGSRLLRAWTRLAPAPLHGLPGRRSERLRLLLDGDPRYRRRVLAQTGLLTPRAFGGPNTALLFTWIDGRSFDPDGGYADPHLGPLAELLRERGLDVAFVARVLHGLPFAEAVERLRGTGETFLFPDAYLTLHDHRECARRASAFEPAIPRDEAVGGVPVGALAREHVAQERPAQARALSLDPLVRRFAETGVRPERIVHTCEGHAWELVLAHAARRHLPETRVIGYENLNMTRLALSMFPARNELSVRPVPDTIVTNGPAFRDVLLAEGVPRARVRTGCALRHRYLWDAAQATGEPDKPLRVLAATELALGPSLELMAKATAAFADDPAYELVVKIHPLRSRHELGEVAARLQVDERPTLELLREADVLLYTYSVVGIEALALGVPPIFVRAESTLDLDQLEFAHELRWEGRTPQELRAAAAEIAALDEAALADWRTRARAAAERALAPVRPECVEAFL